MLIVICSELFFVVVVVNKLSNAIIIFKNGNGKRCMHCLNVDAYNMT